MKPKNSNYLRKQHIFPASSSTDKISHVLQQQNLWFGIQSCAIW